MAAPRFGIQHIPNIAMGMIDLGLWPQGCSIQSVFASSETSNTVRFIAYFCNSSCQSKAQLLTKGTAPATCMLYCLHHMLSEESFPARFMQELLPDEGTDVAAS